MHENWFSERDTQDFSISVRNNLTELLVYFAIRLTSNTSLQHTVDVGLKSENGVNVCRTTYYIPDGEMFRSDRSRLGFIEDCQLMTAVAVIVGLFIPNHTDFVMCFMAIMWMTPVAIAHWFIESTVPKLILVYIGILGLAVFTGALVSHHKNKIVGNSLGLLMVIVFGVGLPSYIQRFFWTWAYMVWIATAIFIFGAANFEFSKHGISIFCNQCLKFTQLLLCWSCLYAVSPLQLRLTLDSYPSRYSNGKIFTALLTHIRIAVIMAIAVVSILAVILQVNRSRNRRLDDTAELIEV
jgi:hypothetical protein